MPSFFGSDWKEAIVAFVNGSLNGALAGSTKSYALLSAATATGPAVAGIRGGDYIWRVEGSFSSGVTATLQYLGLDGTTWKNARNAANTADVSASGEAQVGLGVGQGATLRVLITGTQTTPLNSSLAGLS